MSAGLEVVAVAEWLATVLAADETLTEEAPGGVWHHPVPPSIDPDVVAVTFQLTDAEDITAVGSERVLTRTEWLVRVIGRGDSPAGLRAAYARVDALLHGARCEEVETGQVWACRRVRPFYGTEVETVPSAGGALRFAHLGGIYEIHAGG